MPWMEGESGTWDGGRVFVAKDGSKTFHIKKSVGGVVHEFSTRCAKLGPAMKAYEKWQADNSWRPGREYAERVLLTDALIARHLAWAEEDGPLAQEWKRKKQVYLEWWRDVLAGRDLRTVTLRHLQEALEGVKARTHRKAVIKHLYTFCREKGLLSRDEDPTFDLALPQAGGGVSKKERAVTREEFERTFAKLTDEHHRDILALQAGTGMHVTEAQRLARGQGLVGPDLVAIQHKRGTVHRQSVRPDVAAAARRVRERELLHLALLQGRPEGREGCRRAPLGAGVDAAHGDDLAARRGRDARPGVYVARQPLAGHYQEVLRAVGDHPVARERRRAAGARHAGRRRVDARAHAAPLVPRVCQSDVVCCRVDPE